MSGPHPAAPHRLPPPCPVCADLPGSPHGTPAPPAATPGQAMRDELINRWTARGHCVDGRSWDLLPQVDRDDLEAAAQAAIRVADYARTILPPPGAVVSAAYLVKGTDGPKIILEVCPHCTAATGDDSRMCLCRAQCAYAACRHDDPMTLLVTGAGPLGGDHA